MIRNLALLALGAAMLLSAALVAAHAEPVAAATVTVSVQDDQFSPESITVAVGGTVQWNWTGSNQHTVTSNGAESFDSGAPQSTGTFSHTFNAIGAFSYLCAIHGTLMAGTVKVEAATPTPTVTTLSTNTPLPTDTALASNTPGTLTSTPAATGTPTTTDTPVSATAAAPGTPAVISTAVAPPGARGSVAAGARLPRTGDGPGAQTSPFALLLGFCGVLTILFGIRKRHRA